MNFFQLPIGAGQNDPVVGEVDGAQIRMAPNGTRYYEQYQAPAQRAIIEALTTTLDDQGRSVHDRKPQQPVPGKAVVEALLGGVTQGLTAPGRSLRGEPVTYGDAWATALDYGVGSAPTSAPGGALRSGGIKAYHGSPHDFDRFSMDKIGTGEGVQAYGHGLYFAESEDVARSYRDGLTLTPNGSQVEREVWDAMRYASSPDKAKSDLLWKFEDARATGNTWEAKVFEDALSNFEEIAARRPGHMYEVNINANPDDFLDWDAPLSEQSESVRKALSGDFLDKQLEGSIAPRASAEEGFWSGTGRDVVDDWRSPMEANTAALREAGIPGIKYYDAGSRASAGGEILDVKQGLRSGDGDMWRAKVKVTNRTNTFGDNSDMFKTSPQFKTEAEARAWADDAVNKGTRNFVVFDEDLISIVRKYGIAGAAAYLGMPEDEIRQRVGGT